MTHKYFTYKLFQYVLNFQLCLNSYQYQAYRK